MNTLVVVLTLMAGAGAADELPNINRPGDNEKAFAEKLATAIVKAARVGARDIKLEKFIPKTPEPNRAELHLTATFRGSSTDKTYEAGMVVVFDNQDVARRKVVRIDFSDNSRSLVGYNRKNVEDLVKKLNEK